jgi:di/tripeptidase
MDKIFNEIFKLNETDLYNYLSKKLKIKYSNVITLPYGIYAEGKIPILLVAHLDTVYSHPPKHIFHDTKQNIVWSPEGIGADDRAGVYAILQIIKHYKPHILFCTGEEMQGFGAKKISTLLSPPHVKFMIELDRKGLNDAVFYNCENQKFIDYINSFGFVEDFGTYTDIKFLLWDIASVNLSIGYYYEHSLREYLKVNEMNLTINKVEKILLDTSDVFYSFY